MGLAWIEDAAPPPAEPALRHGGLPLLPRSVRWPTCPACDLEMLFRAQVPLALTSLVSFADSRLLSVFECHATHDTGPCDGAAALLLRDPLEVRDAPRSITRDVIVTDTGEHPEQVLRIVDAVDGYRGLGRIALPAVILRSAPLSIARETVRAILEAGGHATLRESAPVVLSDARGGRVVPFDDGPRALSRTTLPPLEAVAGHQNRGGVIALLGGSLPGVRDYAFRCACNQPTRTAIRLLAQRNADSGTAITLGAAAAQVCLRCAVASVYRTPPARDRGVPRVARAS